MARPEKIKTPLGQRLSDVRKKLGFPERPHFADHLGVPKETLGNYERGDREPNAELLTIYRRRFGVNLNWVITGEGDMFDAGASPNSAFLCTAIQLVDDWLATQSRTMPAATKAEIVGQLYQIITEDVQAGQPQLDQRRAQQFLRLIVDNGR